MPADPQCVSRLSGDRRLHPGEVEAIALAIEKGAILLMDERVGTRIATSQGLMVVGVTGILIRAKRASLVPAVAPLLIELRDVYRFHVSDELLRTARQLAHEE